MDLAWKNLEGSYDYKKKEPKRNQIIVHLYLRFLYSCSQRDFRTQVYGIKYSYQIQITYTRLYGLKYH